MQNNLHSTTDSQYYFIWENEALYSLQNNMAQLKGFGGEWGAQMEWNSHVLVTIEASDTFIILIFLHL